MTGLMVSMLAFVAGVKNKLTSEEKGATAVEYGLLVALIAAVIVGIVATLGTQINTAFTTISDQLQKPSARTKPKGGAAAVRRQIRCHRIRPLGFLHSARISNKGKACRRPALQWPRRDAQEKNTAQDMNEFRQRSRRQLRPARFAHGGRPDGAHDLRSRRHPTYKIGSRSPEPSLKGMKVKTRLLGGIVALVLAIVGTVLLVSYVQASEARAQKGLSPSKYW